MKIKLLFIFILINQIAFSQKSKLNISVDDKIETLYTIAYFDNYFLVSKHQSIYKNKIDKELGTLKMHKAVSLFDTISKKYNFSYNRPVEWILQFSEFPEFKKIKNKSDLKKETIDKEKEYLLEDFKKELIKFNQDSLFQKYLKIIKPFNETVINNIKKSNSINELPSYLEEYYGDKLYSYNLIISPLLNSGGFNAEILNSNGEKDVYAIIGPNGEIDFYPHFDKDYLETDMILHEFSHSFVNPLTNKYEKEVEDLKSKYYTLKLQKNGKEEGYSEWKYVFNEIVIRAIVINITRNKFGNEKADELLSFEKSVGFDLVEVISLKLKEFETDRKKFKSFNDFFPKLLKELK